MSIETVLTLNSIGLGIGVVAIVVLMVLLIRSEWKLAKYDESWFFKRKKMRTARKSASGERKTAEQVERHPTAGLRRRLTAAYMGQKDKCRFDSDSPDKIHFKEAYMAIYQPSQETFNNQRFSMILYGAPGVGKTTAACSAPNPILIDLDKGIQRIRAQHRPPFSRVSTYEELLEDLKSDELKAFDTIIIDTGGSLITLLQDYVMRKDPVNKTKSGTISQKGYGAVKLEFQALTNRFKTVYDKNIIYVFHSVEEKNKDGIAIQRLLCEGSAKNIVWQPCDFGGYVYMNGDQRMIGFTPTDEYFAKGCYGISGVRKIATLGDADKNDYIARMFAEANANIAKDNDFFQAEREGYESVMEQGKKLIESWTKPEQFTNGATELGKLPHKLTSLVELKAICKDRITTLGFVWDKAKKAYVETPKEQPAEEKAEQPEPKKKGRELADDILSGLGVKGTETDDSATKPDTVTAKSADGEPAEKTAKQTVLSEVNE